MLSAVLFTVFSDFRYDKVCVVMLIVVMLSVNVASVILLNVVAP